MSETAERKGMFDDCDNVEEVIGQAIGAGSTCWERLDNAGVFESTRAAEISRAAVVRVRELVIGVPAGTLRPEAS